MPRCLILLLSALLLAPTAWAQGAWHGRRWEPVDGVPSSISSLAQTSDGFIWVGSITGLYRFDGVRFERMSDVRKGDVSESVIALNADMAGGLWIGHESGGISYYRSATHRLVKATGPDQVIHQLLGAPDGSLWGVGASVARFFVVRYSGGQWRRIVEEARSLQPQDCVIGADGTLWMVSDGTIRYLSPGSHEIASTAIRATPEARLAADRQGRVWIDAQGQLVRLSPAHGSTPASGHAVATLGHGSSLTTLLFDGHGDLWRLSAAQGLTRYDGRTFRKLATGEQRLAMAPAQATGAPPSLVDREGNVWIATEGGLEEFTPSAFRVPPGFDQPVAQQWAGRLVMRDGAGHVWLRYGRRLYKVGDDGRPVLMPGRVPPYFTPCPAAGEGVWRFDGRSAMERVGAPEGPRRLPLGAFIDKPGTTFGCAADDQGGLWINTMHDGMARLDGHGATVISLPSDAGRYAYAFGAMAGKALFYMSGGSLWRSDGGGAKRIWNQRDMPLGVIRWMTTIPRGLLLGGPRGIAFYDGKRFHALLSDRFSWLSFTAGGVQTLAGDTWLQTPQGVVRIATSELDHAIADPHYQPRLRLFDTLDGLPGGAAYFNVSGITADPQGRVWVATDHGIAVADPAAMPRGRVPIPVGITAIRTDTGAWAPGHRLVLPSGTSRVDVDYAGLSFTNPARLRFRYRLSGVDKGWIEAGDRRHLTYTNLAPGTFVLTIAADNGDGMWAGQGASIEITIERSFLQSPVAYVLSALLLLALGWLLYQVRVRAVSAAVRRRFEIRLRERERIARDLHDSLLQSVQGVFLRFQSFADLLPRDDPSRGKLEGTLDRAQNVIDEARDHVFDLRDPQEAVSVGQIVDQAVAAVGDLGGLQLDRAVQPQLPSLPGDVAREVQAIMCEAIINAHRHAHAQRIIVSARRSRDAIVIGVRDDGMGIPAQVLASGGLARHFGLIGMRERADQIRGLLTIANAPGGGAEIILSVPCLDGDPVSRLWRLLTFWRR